jgi:hypothetical protein
MTRASSFTQASVERAIKAVRKQGMRVTAMTVKPDGITIHTSSEEEVEAADSPLTAVPKLRDAREKFGGSLNGPG